MFSFFGTPIRFFDCIVFHTLPIASPNMQYHLPNRLQMSCSAHVLYYSNWKQTNNVWESGSKSVTWQKSHARAHWYEISLYGFRGVHFCFRIYLIKYIHLKRLPHPAIKKKTSKLRAYGQQFYKSRQEHLTSSKWFDQKKCLKRQCGQIWILYKCFKCIYIYIFVFNYCYWWRTNHWLQYVCIKYMHTEDTEKGPSSSFRRIDCNIK